MSILYNWAAITYPYIMAGHNKWSKIKNRKAATDAVKSKIFSKMAKLIATASKQTRGDILSPVLRAAIEKAKENNMPSDNIERAIKKGTGVDAESFDEITYEAYGPGGCAIIIEVLTTNRNKSSQEVRFILSKHGYELALPGSAAWAFIRNPDKSWAPAASVPISEEDGKRLEDLINELEENDEVQDVYTNAE